MFRTKSLLDFDFILSEEEKRLVENIKHRIYDFYYIKDLKENTTIHQNIFYYLYLTKEYYSLEAIASFIFMESKTIYRFKKSTEDILFKLIKNENQYAALNKYLK
ncbi:MAG: hypothetical protein K2M08_05330 [Anaeroplasmataceae bacterium]|nr:hypothetical protein [Anaeroplasmataceae bacterium]